MSSPQQEKPQRPTVLVAMATFRRPLLLGQALTGVVREAQLLDPPACILVVDNDPDGGAASAVRYWANQGVRYVHEPQPGIAAARNRALQEASGFDALVFIDDDEVPQPEWLPRLVETWTLRGCAAVTGPVEQNFALEPDSWTKGIGLFNHRRMPSGTRVRSASSNNLLLDMRYVIDNGVAFDSAFGLSGGEDTLLSYGITKAGGDIRWRDDAIVTEYVPADRLTHTWIRRRMLRNSNGWARVQITLSNGLANRLRTKAWLALRALLMAARGIFRYGYGVLNADLVKRCEAERDIISAAGIGLSLVGVVRYEYRRRIPASRRVRSRCVLQRRPPH